MTYDGVIIKPPLDEDTLAHYGVKGMKWGKRKAKIKADLKWKASKVKNKTLEIKAKAKRKYYDPVSDGDVVSKNIGALNKNSKLRSIEDAFRSYDKYGDWQNRGYATSRGELKGATGGNKQTYTNASNLEKGIEAGRERVAAEKKKKKK